jgi:ribonuclease D
MKVISQTGELAATCKALAAGDFVTIDTEFMRESTFWPDLCLIQMAGGAEEVIVDVLADTLSLDPFFELMADESVLKVFHAARQDLEIIHYLANIIPHPIFDTQVAAMVCGFGESVSYGQLVKKLLQRDLDKSSRFTDWSRRPLSEKQLVYALGDVTHLRDLYPMLRDKLSKTGRAGWLDEEMAVLTNPATYAAHPEEAWRRLKMRVKTPKALAVMMEIADWREREAQARNVPRRRVLKDDAIYDIAAQAPRSEQELSALRTVHQGFSRSAQGQGVLEAVRRGLERDRDSLPSIRKQKPLTPDAAAILDLLRVLLKASAGRHGVATKLIATADDLEKIARGNTEDVPALKGWRHELFGADALAIKRGELALAVRDGQVTVIPTQDLTAQSSKDGPHQGHPRNSGPPALEKAGAAKKPDR